ncbi:hypothetical protein AB7813_14620 [Tardiphaga sp. 20_F10_N6_6]|uniref:hypothetical protein n=1 Tax=Tardiphaga sp. 20_F10_N6_6 TaxID=3240788 RepID=UPI003F897D47
MNIDIAKIPTSRVDLLADSSLEAAIFSIRGAMRGARLGYREALYVGAAHCASISHAISEDANLWARFRDLSLWRTGNRQLPPEACDGRALRWVFSLMDDGGRPAEKRVSRQVIAVQSLLDEGIEINGLANELSRRGGFEKIAASNSQKAECSSDAKSISGRVALDSSAPPVEGQVSLLMVHWKKVDGRRAAGEAAFVKLLTGSDTVEALRLRLKSGVTLQKRIEEKS